MPGLNKIDLQLRCPEEKSLPDVELDGCEQESSVIKASAEKRRIGIEDILKAVVARVPARREIRGPLQAMIFDSVFNLSWYRSYFRVFFNGTIKTMTGSSCKPN